MNSTEEKLSQFEVELIRKLPYQVASNTTSIESLHKDFEEIRSDIREFRTEARDDSKALRTTIVGFATALAIPLLLGALKLALFS